MKILMNRLLFSLVLIGLSATTLSAEDGYLYGLEENGDNASFGRLNIASGQIEILNDVVPMFRTQSRFIAAIDSRRRHYIYSAVNDELIVLNLESGTVARRENFDARDSYGIAYDPVTDRFYVLRFSSNLKVHVLDPTTFVESEAIIDANLSHIKACSWFADGQNGRYIVNNASGAYETYSLTDGSLLDRVSMPINILHSIYDPNTAKVYGFLQNSPEKFIAAKFDTGEYEEYQLSALSGADFNVRNCSGGIHWASNTLVSVLNQGWLKVDLATFESEIIADTEGRLYYGGIVCNAGDSRKEVGGTIFSDENENCRFDVAELPVPGQFVSFEPSGIRAYAALDGQFRAYLPVGEHELAIRPEWPWLAECQASPSKIVVEEEGEVIVNIEAPLKAAAIFEHLELSIVSGESIAGREIRYNISGVNRGSVPFNGTIRFMYDQVLENFASAPTADKASSGIAEWDVKNLPIGARVGIVVTLDIPGREDLRGENICAQVELVEDRIDVLANYRRDEICNVIRASYDPNDISVAPVGFGTRGFIFPEDSTLAYTIRFQNVGDAPARDVVILDTLDSDLDVNTLHFGVATHEYTVSLLSGNVLEFRFEGIELPGKDEDEPASHGAVKFKVNVNQNLARGTEIHNRAAIYFDFNKPVITNTVVNTLSAPVTDVTEHTDLDQLELRSLSNDLFVLHGMTSLETRVSVYSILGTKVFESSLGTPGSMTLDLRNQPSGRYLIRVQSGGASVVKSVSLIR